MKKKSMVWIVCFTVCAMFVSGCGTAEESVEFPAADVAEEVDGTELYKDILDDFYRLIANGTEEDIYFEGSDGVAEALWVMGENALDGIGYSIKDISGDGIPELLVGVVDDSHLDKEIYAVYTCQNDTPVCTFSGWSRNSYTSMGDGRFFYHGSNGAMYSIFGTYTISPDGTSLICEDYYFTYEKDESFSEIGFYHNTTEAWDKDASEELDISEEEFWSIEEDLRKQTESVPMTPFSAYEYAVESTAELPVTAVFASDADVSAYDEFIADTDELQENILFMTKSTVKDFQVLSLSLEDVDENGKVTFSTEKLYGLGELTPQRPLMVGMTMYGTIPNYGISYVDENGDTRCFSVGISGMDGSLLLEEF